MRVAGATRGSARGVTDIRIGSDDWLGSFIASLQSPHGATDQYASGHALLR